MNIFVAKLNYSTQPDSLRSVFEEFGAVDNCKVIMDKFTGKSKGYGFVEMPNDGEAIVVKQSTPKPQNDRRNDRY